jgi:protein ImuA
MSLKFSSVFPLKHARAHEVCGDSALSFAAIAAGMTKGAVVWISEDWRPTVNPEGLAPYCDPGRLLLTRAGNQLTALASAETALRSGAAGLVVTELSGTVGLTEGRRLQLAAEAGRTTAILLIPEGAGSNAAETRWRSTGVAAPSGPSSGLAPVPRHNGHDSTHWRWSLIKNKIGTLSEWVVRWDAAAHRVIVVSEAGG